jgi:hypothetical protein
MLSSSNFDVGRWLRELGARGVQVDLLPNDRLSIGPRLAVRQEDLAVFARHRDSIVAYLGAGRRVIASGSAPILAAAVTPAPATASKGATVGRPARTQKSRRHRATASTVDDDPRQPLIRTAQGLDTAPLGRPPNDRYGERPARGTHGRALVADDDVA